ncbi:kinase-like protein [Rhizophagus irregularis]|nr:kinase-like protein [Rhizophagus irregularis]
MHRRFDFCSRIIRILGISFDESTGDYLFVMQYADGGNLRNYLKENFSILTWNDKIKLAYQITEGIKYLHGENILHRDLHSKNIVIHRGEAKIIDLGIAKSTETETHLHSGVFGMVPYIDPKVLESGSYKYEKKSDIYSLGVLMWELSSGYPPFHDNEDLIVLKIRLIEGIREDPISNTPCEYLKLYQSCWNSEPDARPSIEQVFNKLEEILNLQNNTNHDDDDDGGDDDDGDGGDGDGGDGGDGSDGGSTSTSQDSTNELESLDSLQIDLT